MNLNLLSDPRVLSFSTPDFPLSRLCKPIEAVSLITELQLLSKLCDELSDIDCLSRQTMDHLRALEKAFGLEQFQFSYSALPLRISREARARAIQARSLILALEKNEQFVSKLKKN